MAEPACQNVYAVFGTSYEASDGYLWPDYDYLASDIYESKTDADAECLRLCNNFYKDEDPTLFVNTDLLSIDDDADSWEQVRECVEWSEPFHVRQLNIHLLQEVPWQTKRLC